MTFNWKHENPVESPFVAHLATKAAAEKTRQPFEIRLHYSEKRPSTAPSASEYPNLRPRSTASEKAAMRQARPSSKKIRKRAGPGKFSSDKSRPGSVRTVPEEEEEVSCEPEPEETSEAPDSGFNPLRSSVFAASLASDLSPLHRRLSTVESLAAFAISMSHIETLQNVANGDSEDAHSRGTSASIKGNREQPPPRQRSLQRQISDRSRFSADGGDSLGKFSSRSSSFSSLPPLEENFPRESPPSAETPY